jgi:hypothetical protein
MSSLEAVTQRERVVNWADLAGLTPVGVRVGTPRPLLQWRVDGRIVESDFSHFRPVRMFEIPPENELRVVWRSFSDVPMTAPFFKDAMDQSAALKNSPEHFETDWEVVRSVANQPGNLALNGTIFHMARTGSTLIHRMLSATGSVLSLSEVPMMDRVLYSTLDYPNDSRSQIIRDVVNTYGQPRRPGEQHYVLKMTDAMANVRLAQYRSAFPDKPWIFVYRDPIEVMVSISRQGTGTMGQWMRNRLRGAERLGIPALANPAMWPEEFMARTLRRFCSMAVQAARATAPGKFLAINYSRLPEAVWETIAPHFGIELTARERALMQAQSQYSSKKRDTVEFTPDSKDKLEAAKPYVRQLAERFVVPAIEELRSLPQG